jgi:hypothetical protein
MLVLADDAALARLVIATTAIPRRARSRRLHNLGRTSKTAPQVGRASAVKQRDSARALPPALVEYNAEVLNALIALRSSGMPSPLSGISLTRKALCQAQS